jgi:hypothetical protein
VEESYKKYKKTVRPKSVRKKLKQRIDWDRPLTFEESKEPIRAKKPKDPHKLNLSLDPSREKSGGFEKIPKTIEEMHKEFKKKRKIKHIETSMDIDEEFAQLPKRLRTRVTKKQLHYVMNNTTMGDIVSHLMSQQKFGIMRAPKTKIQKFNPSNKKEKVTIRYFKRFYFQNPVITEL